MKKSIKLLPIISLFFLITQSMSIQALEYGQVVRFQCERTGQYLSFDPTVDANGEYKIILQDEPNDDTLWIIKGSLQGPVSESSPYDRWNCMFGDEVPASGYDARIEHVIVAYDARFGEYTPEVTDHTNPYSFKLGTTKLEDSGAIHYYNIVLNLNGEKKILISNEYLCALDNNDAALTQDATVDTWNIIPVYMMTEDQKMLEGQDLIDALKTGTSPADVSEQMLADHLTEDVQGLIDFYNNEVAYCQEIKNAFAAIAAETDINVRLSIAQGLEAHTMAYNDQKAVIFGTIVHPETFELIQCIQDSLAQNKVNITDLEADIAYLNNEKATLEGEKQALNDELNMISTDLSSVGATSVPDLTDKVNQLISMLSALWQTP